MNRRITNVVLLFVLIIFPTAIAVPTGIVSAQGSSSHDGVVLLFGSLPGGFARGRTLRLTVVNPPGSRAADGRKYKMLVAPLVLDLEGRSIAELDETEVPEGGSRSFDFNRDDISLAGEPGTGRIQVNAQIRYRFLPIVDRARSTKNPPGQSSRPLTLAGQLKLFDANGKQIMEGGEQEVLPGEFQDFGLDRGHQRRAGTSGANLQVRASFTLRTIHREGDEQFRGSLAIVNNQTSKVEAQQGWLLIARQRENSESGNQAVTGRITGVAVDPSDVRQPPSVTQKSAGGGAAEAVAPRGWDPKKKVAVAGSSETSQEQARDGDPDRPIVVGSVPNSQGDVPGGPGFDSVRSLGSLSFNFTKVELAREETLHVTLTNRMVLKRQQDDPPRLYALVKLYDSTGKVIAQSQKVSLPRNQARPVTFNRSAIPLPGDPRTSRLKIRVGVELHATDRNTVYVSTAGGGVWASLKVIDNVTGKSIASASGQVNYDPRIIYLGTGEANNAAGSPAKPQDIALANAVPDSNPQKNKIAIDSGNSTAPVQGGFGNDRMGMIGHGNNVNPNKPANQRPRAAQPDLAIKQFLFPPTNDKALRVQIANDGNAASGACRLLLTIRKINGTAVGRQTHVNIPVLTPGQKVWLVIDAKSILPVSVSLKSTTFKLNADGTEIVLESDETNNEVWHNL